MTEARRNSYKMNGSSSNTPFLIGVSGGTASGKSTVCKRIMEKLGQENVNHSERQVVCISQDSFYRDLTPAEMSKAEKGQFNFDHPDAFNEILIKETLMDILAGKIVKIPTYDYKSHTLMKNELITIYPADVVLFEGILVFYFPEVRKLFHMKLFVDTHSDTRLARRVKRDIGERGRELEAVLNQYINFVKPAFDDFCLPTKKFADVIIPRGADNLVAIDLIVCHILDIMHGKPSINGVNGVHYGTPDNTSFIEKKLRIAVDLIVQHIREILTGGSRIPKIEQPPPSNSPTPESPTRRAVTTGDPLHKRPH